MASIVRISLFRLPLLRLIALVAITLSVANTTQAQDDAKAFDGAVVALPPFYVEPTDGATWLRASLPDFELLTTHDRTFVRQFVRVYMEQSRALEEFVPAKFLWRPHLPETYIVVDADSKRSNPDEIVSQVINENRASQSDRRGRHRFMPNLRLSSPDSSIIFAFMDEDDLDEDRSRDSRSFIQQNISAPGVRRPIPGFRFSTNRLGHQLSNRAPALPTWFIAGLVVLYDRCDFRPGKILIGGMPKIEARPPAAETGDVPPILALNELLVLPAPTDETALKTWTQHTELFMRWCLFSSRKSNRTALWEYLDRIVLETPSEPLFESCFGLSFAAAEKQIDKFHRNRATKRFVHSLPRARQSPEAQIEPASRSDVARVLSEWERLETLHVKQNFPELYETYLTRARQTIVKARHTTGGSPELDATAGLLEFEAGNFGEATTNLETAIAEGTTRPLAYRTLALLRYQALGEERPLEIAAIDPIVSLLIEAHQQSPAIPEVYIDLAEIWEAAQSALSRTEVGVLAAGVRGFPRNIPLVTQMVLMQANRGQLKSAQQILDYAQTRAAQEEKAEILQALSERLQAMIPVEGAGASAPGS